LDVGAGKGRFASELALYAKHLQLKLFDYRLCLSWPKPIFKAKACSTA